MIKGYTKAVKSKLRRIILNVEGQEKEGKTHFALTAPGPIALIDMDTGLESVVDKFVKGKDIWIKSYNWQDATDQGEWVEMWESSKASYLDAVKSKEVRTIVVDTATEWYEMVRLARFGKLNKVAMVDGKAVPLPWGPVNTEFRDLIKKVYESDKNLVLVHKLKKEYIKDTWTGDYERAGYGDMQYIVQMNIRVWRSDEGAWGITIRDCRQNAELVRQEITDPMPTTFAFLASQVFLDTKEEDWE